MTIGDASPAELVEAAVRKLGYDRGAWTVEFVLREGQIERYHAKSTAGRGALVEVSASVESSGS